MSKLKNPLFSLDARGGVAKVISFVKRGGRHIVMSSPVVPDARTLAQLSWRHMYQKAVALWHALSVAERQEWESLARPKHMTGFAWFMSQALKPNPGLYLPLQGGTMAGDIDLDKHRILKLPLPIDDQEPATKKYHDDNLPAGPYTEGCKVFHSVHQSIPHGSSTYLSFDSEDYDTDEMHDLITNPERITIKTAGIYLIIFHGVFDVNATGYRRAEIRRNGFTPGRLEIDARATRPTHLILNTLWQLSIGEYLRIRVYQNSGGPLIIQRLNHHSPYFHAQRIG